MEVYDELEKALKEIERLTAESTEWESKYYDEAKKVDKAIEVIDLIKPELWNISNKMTYRLLDIKNILRGEDNGGK